MTESSDYTTETTPVVTESVAERTVVVTDSKPNRLYQVAAWVAIVAGTLFIVSVVFFSGFLLGKHSGGSGHFGRHGGGGMMMDRHGPPMGSMHRGGPGQSGPDSPGAGDGWPGDRGQGGPSQPPPTR